MKGETSLLTRALLLAVIVCTIATLTWAQSPATIFQLDGNPAPDGTQCNYGSGLVQCDTWNLLNLAGSSGSGRGQSEFNTFILGTSTTNSFQGGGSKDALDLSSWAYSATGTPNKDTLNAGYAAAYNLSGDFDVIFGADRLSPNGDANIGIWFFQQSVGLANGKFVNTATGLAAHHVNGDVFLISAFTGGGGNSTISAYKWDNNCTTAVKNPKVGDCAASNLRVLETASSVCGTNDECAATNGSTVSASWASYSGNSIASPLFFEGGLDITKAFAGSATPCFASFLEETRSSQSTSAVLKDFLLGSFPVCSISVTKACGTATLSGSTITFPVGGTVTNTGIGTLYNVQVLDAITGGSTNTINVASTLAGGASASWNDSSTSSTSTSETDTAQAQAASVSGGSATVFSSSVSKTCEFTVTNSLTVSKSCTAGLVAPGGTSPVHVSVSYGGQVCNTGQSRVTNITLTDYPGSSTSGASVANNITVNAGACVSYGQFSYTPTEIDSTPTAGRDFFKDTITISSATPQFGTLSSISGNPDPRVNGKYAFDVATCPICPAGFCAP
jgi:hypothetical protein